MIVLVHGHTLMLQSGLTVKVDVNSTCDNLGLKKKSKAIFDHNLNEYFHIKFSVFI